MASTLEALLLSQVNFLLYPPKFAAYQATSFSTGTSTGWFAIPVDTIINDNYSGWSNVNPTRYTAQVAAWYEPTAVVCWSNVQTTGWRSTMVGVNGTRTVGSAQDLPAGPDFTTVASKPIQVYLNIGDYLEIWGYTSVASSTAVGLPDLRTRLDVRLVSL